MLSFAGKFYVLLNFKIGQNKKWTKSFSKAIDFLKILCYNVQAVCKILHLAD